MCTLYDILEYLLECGAKTNITETILIVIGVEYNNNSAIRRHNINNFLNNEL